MDRKYFLTIFTAAILMVFASLPARASETDSRIEDAAKNSYTFKTHLKEDSVSVKSQDGVVTLTGKVANGNHKRLAQDTVESLPDVTSVDNQLQVTEEDQSENPDAWLGFKAKTALLYHRNVSALATHIDVKDGVVTLTGEAESQAQKDLTGEYVKNIDGVKDVTNNINVVEPRKDDQEKAEADKDHADEADEQIDDATITAQVKITLSYHRATSGLKTGVETKDGVVTLTGKAKNGAEKDLVTEYVSDIRGVKKVVNDMSVE